MSETKPTGVEKAIDELLTDPDAPEKGHADRPPQTIDAEPAERPDR